jgi:hypothetical protein
MAKAPRGYLNLRIGLRDEDLSEGQIRSLTQGLSDLARQRESIGVRKIDWLGFTPARISYFERASLVIHAINRWRAFVQKKRDQRLAQAGIETPQKTA